MIPQLVKVIREKCGRYFSAYAFGSDFRTVFMGMVWFVKDELPIILSNSFAVLVNISLLFVI
jgi:MtN3 and saliva related transmembrane protein